MGGTNFGYLGLGAVSGRARVARADDLAARVLSHWTARHTIEAYDGGTMVYTARATDPHNVAALWEAARERVQDCPLGRVELVWVY